MEIRFPTARNDGRSRLYHYEDFSVGYLTRLLRDQSIYCSNPSKLNDPWDCRPFFDASFVGDPNERDQWIEWLKKAQAEPIPEPTIYRLRTDQPYLLNTVLAMTASFGRLIPNKWGIYCLSPHPTSTLMWSHYASKHTGICLEFSTENNILFPLASRVNYRSEYPRISPHLVEDFNEVMLTKSDDWSYENEYRLIARMKPGPLDSGHLGKLFLATDRFLPFPSEALLSVILGCESKDLGVIRHIVKEYAPNLLIKRAVRIANKYKLVIQESGPQ